MHNKYFYEFLEIKLTAILFSFQFILGSGFTNSISQS